jgi:ABC-2 type transport system permease protein
LALEEVNAGIGDLLEHYGVTVGPELVMDPQNARYPEVVQRNIGGVTVQEVRAIDYPFFISVLPDGMAGGHPSTASLPQVTLMWASPLTLAAASADKEFDVLLSSSAESWLRSDSTIQPNFEAYPLGFPVEGESTAQPLAVAVRGSFESFYSEPPQPQSSDEAAPALLSNISKSPDNTRLVVVGSAEAFNDLILNLASQLGQDRSLNNQQFLQNTIDWSVEDADLLSIRSRGAYTRVLKPLTENQQRAWELANYLLAVLALVLLAAFWQVQKRRARPLFSGGDA